MYIYVDYHKEVFDKFVHKQYNVSEGIWSTVFLPCMFPQISTIQTVFYCLYTPPHIRHPAIPPYINRMESLKTQNIFPYTLNPI